MPILDHEGAGIEAPPAFSLCRCGGSSRKPFCDGTHKSNNFNGQEFASKDTAADLAQKYASESVTIHDDRSRCAHAGVCTDKLREVFKLGVEPWIDPNRAQARRDHPGGEPVPVGGFELLDAGLCRGCQAPGEAWHHGREG